jgi:hypothetical protein
MTRRRISKNYTIQPFKLGPDQSEIELLMINFQAENLSSAQARAMRYAMDDSFMRDIHGLKLLRNNAEVWRWSRGDLGGGRDDKTRVRRVVRRISDAGTGTEGEGQL